MLHRVDEYVRRKDIPHEPGFSARTARFAIVCNHQGDLEGVVELGDASKKNNLGQEFARAPEYTFSEMKLPGKFRHRAHFLLESASTVALYGAGEHSNASNKHKHFCWLLHEAAKATKSKPLLAIEALLGRTSALKQVRAELEQHKARPTDSVTFRVEGRFPIADDYWHAWWAEHRRALQVEMDYKRKKAAAGKMRCFLTGDPVVPAWTLGKLTEISPAAGGSPMGNVLTGFDKEAFCSYGLEQSQNAAMSERAGKIIEAGLNELLKREESSHVIAGVQIVHWYKRSVPPADDPVAFLYDPPREEREAERRAARLVESIRTGKAAELGDADYYILQLSGSGGRVMVRSWQEGRFEELADAVERWFSDLSIARLRDRGLAASPRIELVITSVLPGKKPRQDWGDWVKPVATLRQMLWNAAVRGTPIPWDAVARVVFQFRSFCLTGEMEDVLAIDRELEQRALTLARLYCRMALIKAYHLRKNNPSGSNRMSYLQPYLNPNHPSAAYHCGRMMAVLADLQRAALGNVGANVIQRYYAAASATPALVFGRLTRNSKYHLDKLEPGLAHWYESRLADIATRLGDAIPPTLTLEEQSLFALGYYQQTAQTTADIRAKTEKNNREEMEDKA